MSGSLPSVGAHCAISSCHLNDFLPIRCKCQAVFCKDHIAADAHDCPLALAIRQEPGEASSMKLLRCAAQTCNKPSLESYILNTTDTANRTPALCSSCHQAFCAEHRERSSHVCTSPQSPSECGPEKNAAAKALLSKHFGAPPSQPATRTPNAKPSSTVRKQAAQRQIAAMKLRHQAQPGDPKDAKATVPMNDRLHLRVEGMSKSERVFWFRKNITTGRAVDMLATHFGLMISDSQPLKLLEGDTVLRMDQPLGDQVADGSSLTLSR